CAAYSFSYAEPILTVSSIGGNGVFAFIVKRFRVFRRRFTDSIIVAIKISLILLNIAHLPFMCFFRILKAIF
ncbi:hypothetical protein ACRASH_11350, partial [Staphylococcus aureus]